MNQKRSENPGQFSRQAINDRVLQEVSTLGHLSVSGDTGRSYLNRTVIETPNNEPAIRGIKPREVYKENLRFLRKMFGDEQIQDAIESRLIEVV